MGIDIYLEWDGITDEDKKNQMTGFSTVAGHVGYLREAYHGGPYATRILCREAFESESCSAQIPADTLEERLTGLTEPACTPNAGHEVARMIAAAFCDPDAEPATAADTTRPMSVYDAIVERYRSLYPEAANEYIPKVMKSFHDFVELAKQKEKETGHPCKIIASY